MEPRPGTPETTSGNGRICAYESPAPPNDMIVIVGQAPDAATAQAEWATEQQKLEQYLGGRLSGGGSNSGVNFSYTVPNVALSGADRAAVLSGSANYSGRQFAATDFMLLKGATFFFMGDVAVGGPAASPAAMQQEAATVVGQLP